MAKLLQQNGFSYLELNTATAYSGTSAAGYAVLLNSAAVIDTTLLPSVAVTSGTVNGLSALSVTGSASFTSPSAGAQAVVVNGYNGQTGNIVNVNSVPGKSGDLLVVDKLGNLAVTSSTGSLTTPSYIRLPTAVMGQASQFDFGLNCNSLRNANGYTQQQCSYNEIVFTCGLNSVAMPQWFLANSAKNNVRIANTSAAQIALQIEGLNATGNLTNWYNNASLATGSTQGTLVASMSASGNLIVSGGLAIGPNAPLTLGPYGSNPSAPLNGQMWYNTPNGAFVSYQAGMIGAIARKIFSSATQTTVSNAVSGSIVPTSGIGTMTLAPNYLNIYRVVKLELDGLLNLGAATSVAVTLSLGGTTLASATISSALLTAMTNARANVDVRICCRAISPGNSSCTVFSVGGFYVSVAGNAYRTEVDLDNNGTAITTINPTVANLIDVKVTFGAASTSNTFVTNQCNLIEI